MSEQECQVTNCQYNANVVMYVAVNKIDLPWVKGNITVEIPLCANHAALYVENSLSIGVKPIPQYCMSGRKYITTNLFE